MGPFGPHFRLLMNAVTQLKPHLSATDARGFGHVDTWIFDLDNTLYPSEARVWPQVDDRITLFIANLYGIDGLSARALQKYFYHRYGTTLKALMDEDGIDPYEFLDFAHDIDHSDIELNPLLGEAIEKLPGRKLILSNGSRKHAEAVAMKLGIYDHFEDVFDIAAANLDPKPLPQVYDRFLARHGVNPQRAAMFEDLARNLEVPHTLGMTTVLVVPEGAREVFREDWELQGRDAPHVDHVTDNLLGFLQGIAQSGPPRA